MKRLAVRQVHLDFHSSEHIPGIGSKFSKKNFQEALLTGHLDSITLFAKGHHSWCYYPTKTGRMHPHLSFDLMGEMMDAAHEIGVKAPLYITVGWSSNDGENHPEWLARNKDGSPQLTNYSLEAKPEDKRPVASWKVLCPSGAYASHIYDLTREISERYPKVDGLFYDICFIDDRCYCESCLKAMGEQGLDPEKEDDARAWYIHMRRDFMARCTEIVRERHPESTVFFNGGADQYRPQYHDLQTHFELEDLPTTWGGYDKMPPRAKYFARTGKDYLGMTGKFHTMWGEFGGFKNPAALRYECAAMLTYGAGCSVGDQLHPSGEMDMDTYRSIGYAYEYVKQMEDYCFGAEETARLGILQSGDPQSDEGLVKMLLERQMDFDIVLPGDPLFRFDAIILPDSVVLDEEAAARIEAFAAYGGGVLLTGESGLNKEKDRLLIDTGADDLGPSEYENDYVCAGTELAEGIVSSPFLFYEAARKVGVRDGKIWASLREPYFNRTYARYCSHQNTPYKLEKSPYPAAVGKGSVIHLTHKICKMYFVHGAQYHRDYFINALRLVYKNPVMKADMPSAGRARFVRQSSKNRYILHLLYGAPVRRGRAEVIEDLPPLYRIPLRIRAAEKIERIYSVPKGVEIPFTQKNGVVEFTVPEVQCHQAVVLEYGK